jgi:DNA-binding transcriptional ArsR family regulator
VTAKAAAATRTASVFDALGDPSRLRIVIGLCDSGPSSTLQVAQAVPLSRQAATKHLELLQAVGVLSSVKRGRERIWAVEPQPLTAAGDYLTALSNRWDRAIGRLQAYLDDDSDDDDDSGG